MAITVITSKCPQNHPCPAVRICPQGALSQEGFNAPTVSEEDCIDCGICSDFCPKACLILP